MIFVDTIWIRENNRQPKSLKEVIPMSTEY